MWNAIIEIISPPASRIALELVPLYFELEALVRTDRKMTIAGHTFSILRCGLPTRVSVNGKYATQHRQESKKSEHIKCKSHFPVQIDSLMMTRW